MIMVLALDDKPNIYVLKRRSYNPVTGFTYKWETYGYCDNSKDADIWVEQQDVYERRSINIVKYIDLRH